MTGYVKANGSWTGINEVYVKIDGTWVPLGDPLPSIAVTVLDENGNITSGATVWFDAEPYSLIYDKSLASDSARCLTYAGACAGFTSMVGASGNADEGSWAVGNGTLFDSIKVGYIDGSTFVETSKSAMPEDLEYNCFTRIPKIYQKVTDLGNSQVQLDLSLVPFDGATLHPAFVIDGVEINYKDIGRYIGHSYDGPLLSQSGTYPTSDKTRAEFRTLAKSNGDNYGLLSYYDWDLVNKLYLLAFKNFNGQSALGAGYTNASGKNYTGATDGLSWMSRATGTYPYISFLGIEDWWGNLSQWIDNYLTDSSNIYVSQTASPSDSVSDMDVLCANPGSAVQGYPLTCRAGLNDFFIGADEAGSANATGMCDYQYFGSGSYLAVVGGYWSIESSPGPFYFYSGSSLSGSYSYVGARLVHWE